MRCVSRRWGSEETALGWRRRVGGLGSFVEVRRKRRTRTAPVAAWGREREGTGEGRCGPTRGRAGRTRAARREGGLGIFLSGKGNAKKPLLWQEWGPRRRDGRGNGNNGHRPAMPPRVCGARRRWPMGIATQALCLEPTQ
jgi:hypothetical protein